jgi:uncharacterized protein YggE
MKKSILILVVLISGLQCFGQLKDNLLKIKGNAILYQIPEIMYVNIPIELTDSIYENCSIKLAKIHADLKHHLVKNGIKKKDLKTDNLSIGKKTKFTKNGRIPDGFQGSISVKIEMKYSQTDLNKIINVLKNENFDFGYKVGFGLSEEQKSQTLRKSIELAIDDAEIKAQIIGSKMQLKLLEIKEINFGYSGGNFDVLTPESEISSVEYEEEVSSKELEIDINPKKIRITKSVNVIWRIEKL